MRKCANFSLFLYLKEKQKLFPLLFGGKNFKFDSGKTVGRRRRRSCAKVVAHKSVAATQLASGEEEENDLKRGRVDTWRDPALASRFLSNGGLRLAFSSERIKLENATSGGLEAGGRASERKNKGYLSVN